MGHRYSLRSGDDTSKFRRFGYMLVADPDYVLALYPYPYHTPIPVPAGAAPPARRIGRSVARGRAAERPYLGRTRPWRAWADAYTVRSGTRGPRARQ